MKQFLGQIKVSHFKGCPGKKQLLGKIKLGGKPSPFTFNSQNKLESGLPIWQKVKPPRGRSCWSAGLKLDHFIPFLLSILTICGYMNCTPKFVPPVMLVLMII
ncbi:MAG: hypothetical protein DRI99_00820 [Candidatus Aminicenantes bacterium]|nr:MAG: hypothetical protein DRJ11_11980 [Candidatus Aminicenantes bacterium]RLE06009.1 MAG: hypothetical protein DRI99_00820 [Candidatus Aminicenantes bacterium]